MLGAGYWLSWPRRFLEGESPPAPPFAEKYFTTWTVFLQLQIKDGGCILPVFLKAVAVGDIVEEPANFGIREMGDTGPACWSLQKFQSKSSVWINKFQLNPI